MKIAASNLFAVTVTTDNFAPTVPLGCQLFFQRGELAKPGDIVAVRHSDNDPKLSNDPEIQDDPKLGNDPELQDDPKLGNDPDLQDDLNFCIEPFREGVGYFAVAVQATVSVREQGNTYDTEAALETCRDWLQSKNKQA